MRFSQAKNTHLPSLYGAFIACYQPGLSVRMVQHCKCRCLALGAAHLTCLTGSAVTPELKWTLHLGFISQRTNAVFEI